VDEAKRERRFLEAVRLSGLVPESEIDRSLQFQKFAHARGKPLPLDRILLRFGLLDEKKISALYQALTYFLWRKEDKLYGRVAVKNQLITEEDMKACLKEQKKAFNERRELKRVNVIAFEKGLLNPREDRALVTKLRETKPGLTIEPLDRNGGPRGPAKKGEEEQWRREMRARELGELQKASGIHKPKEESSHTERFGEADIPPEPGEASGNQAFVADDDDELAPLPATPGTVPPTDDDDDIGDPLSQARGAPISDDDLDPLWAEQDLDEVELDSEQRQAESGTKKGPPSSAEEDTDLF
jgi:hypothetical protein